MLVLSRKFGECLLIGDDIRIQVVGIRGDKVRLGIEAPANVVVLRDELLPLAPEPATDAPLTLTSHHP